MRSMETTLSASLYKGHRFPPEIIRYCVWLYYRFSLSYRDIEEIMAERGVQLTYETVRKWCLKFGQRYANALRRSSPQPGNKWYLDEVFLTIHGQVYSAWRAVDQHGAVLKVLVQHRRDKKAAQKFFHKLLKDWQYVPRTIITDKLASYEAAKREMLPGVEHRQQKGREYSRREFTPAYSATRANHARVQITRTSPAVSFGI
jgi:putative transposase